MSQFTECHRSPTAHERPAAGARYREQPYEHDAGHLRHVKSLADQGDSSGAQVDERRQGQRAGQHCSDRERRSCSRRSRDDQEQQHGIGDGERAEMSAHVYGVVRAVDPDEIDHREDDQLDSDEREENAGDR